MFHYLLQYRASKLQYLHDIPGFIKSLYKATGGEICFFSETVIENIDAVNKGVKALIKTETGEIVFIATNVGFHF